MIRIIAIIIVPPIFTLPYRFPLHVVITHIQCTAQQLKLQRLAYFLLKLSSIYLIYSCFSSVSQLEKPISLLLQPPAFSQFFSFEKWRTVEAGPQLTQLVSVLSNLESVTIGNSRITATSGIGLEPLIRLNAAFLLLEGTSISSAIKVAQIQ